jgi:hypothetical protein
LLGSYLITKQRQRARAREGQPLNERHMPGAAFDASAVSPRIQLLRKDYFAQLHSRPKSASRRELLLASFRKAIRQIGYFRNLTVENRVVPDHEHQT